MATKKARYIIFKIINSENTQIKMRNDSFLNIFKDRMYEKHGLKGITRFEDVFVTLFLVHNQILIMKVPRIIKNEIVESVKNFQSISGRNIRFESLTTKSSIKRLKIYLKKTFKSQEEELPRK